MDLMTIDLQQAAPIGGLDGPIGAALTRLIRDYRTYFPEASAPPALTAVSAVSRRLSSIARATLAFPDATLTVYVKAHRKPTSPIERVRRKARLEFDTLRALHERFADLPGLGVVRPIAFFDEEIVVVTEASAGENLHRVIKRLARGWPGAAARAQLEEHCRATGRWLRHFQTFTAEPRRAPLPVDDLLAGVQDDLAACVAMGLRQSAAARLQEFCRQRLEPLRGRAFPVVGEHPDFQPDNVVVSPGQVTVLDFTSFRPGSAHNDPARFVAHLAFLAKHPLYARSTLKALGQAFLAGYGAPPAGWPFHVARYLIQSARTAGTWPRPAPVKWLIRRRAAAFLGACAPRLAGADEAFLDRLLA
jgi:hypothetical protein